MMFRTVTASSTWSSPWEPCTLPCSLSAGMLIRLSNRKLYDSQHSEVNFDLPAHDGISYGCLFCYPLQMDDRRRMGKHVGQISQRMAGGRRLR